MTSDERTSVAGSAADRLEAARKGGLDRFPALVGFDGFVDAIIHVVGSRRSMADEDFQRIATIPEFAARCGGAAGKSTNIELFVHEERFGGNGPLMAGALGRLGMPVTFIGAVGEDDGSEKIAEVFAPFAERCREVIPVGSPGHTDALEFDDGKIMLGKPQAVQAVTWERLVERVGEDELRRRVENAKLLGIVNWTLCGGVQGIWEGLREHVLPKIEADPDRRLFVDLSDPAKRTDEDIRSALEELGKLNKLVRVTLGLNRAEAERIARVLGLDAFDDAHNYPLGSVMRRGAGAIRQELGLACVVVHPREGAAAANAEHDAWFEGPFTASPRLSTGAGDHFNGGFAFAQTLGLDLKQSLAVGTAVSGAYVRDAVSPDLERLIGFLRDLPAPER